MDNRRICTLPGAGAPGGECGAEHCSACFGGRCTLPRHILFALQARESAPYMLPDTGNPADLENRTARVLSSWGMKQSLSGYRLLQVAVRIGIQDPEKLRRVSARLMPAVAEECCCSVDSADRNIRTAVLSVFEQPNEALLDMFPVVRDGDKKFVPNKWFISALADVIRRGVAA